MSIAIVVIYQYIIKGVFSAFYHKIKKIQSVSKLSFLKKLKILVANNSFYYVKCQLAIDNENSEGKKQKVS